MSSTPLYQLTNEKNKHQKKQDSHTLYKHWLGTQLF